jgi:uncharacterized protein with PIN domain
MEHRISVFSVISSLMTVKEKLAADRMLMRLARWLRLLGADVITDASLSGAELLRVARSGGRVLITRDKRLRTAPDVIFVESNSFRDQLREVVIRLGIDARAIAFTRCSQCNHLLVPVARELVGRRVPPYVFASHDRFSECEGCGRIYWPETHPARIRALLDSIGV